MESFRFVLLAMAGKVSKDLQDVIMKRPQLFASLLRELSIRPERLKSQSERVPLEQYLELYRKALERTGDPDLGLYVGHIIFFSGMNLHLYMTTICRNLPGSPLTRAGTS